MGPPEPFRYQALPMRVRFGAGALAQLPEVLDELDLRRVLVVSTPGHASLGVRAAELAGPRVAGLHPHARMHVPADVAQAARAAASAVDADGLVAVGGGSAIGLAKAVALTSGLPVVAVPTTYSGSELTSIWGLTEDGRKRTGRDPRVLPVAVLYDPELTTGLPVDVSVTSGLNAVAHAAEALYAPDASPLVSLMAREGVTALADALPAVVTAPSDPGARARALYGAWLCGACLGATTMGLHHRLCHVLGGVADLPHAPTHAVVLPHVLAFTLPAAPDAAASLGAALGADDPARTVDRLGVRLGAPRSLRELGLPDEDALLAQVADQVLAAPPPSPRPLTRDALLSILRAAAAGDPPG